MALTQTSANASRSDTLSQVAASSRVYPGKGKWKPKDLARLSAVSDENTPPKRPHSAIETLSDDNDDDYGHNRFSSDPPITEDCDSIRRKITTLINNGEMKVTEFQRACSINSSSYQRFMKLTGPTAGVSNQTYPAAFQFFATRSTAGIKEPTKKKVKKDEESKKLDVSSITLEGEDDESVEVYDTCDEIRRKIAAYLREPNVTQAAFLRTLAQMLPEPGVRIQSTQLKEFQKKKGPLAGNTSRVYYAAYVFFEKLRVLQGKKKSKARVETEEVWGWKGGIERDRVQGKVWCAAGGTPSMDNFGRIFVR